MPSEIWASYVSGKAPRTGVLARVALDLALVVIDEETGRDETLLLYAPLSRQILVELVRKAQRVGSAATQLSLVVGGWAPRAQVEATGTPGSRRELLVFFSGGRRLLACPVVHPAPMATVSGPVDDGTSIKNRRQWASAIHCPASLPLVADHRSA